MSSPESSKSLQEKLLKGKKNTTTYFAVKSDEKVSTSGKIIKVPKVSKSDKLKKQSKPNKKTAVKLQKKTQKITFDSDSESDSDIETEKPGEIVNTKKNTKVKKERKSYNKDLIDAFSQLETIMMSKGEPFRARAYKKAKESIMTHTTPIYSEKDLEGLPGVGKTLVSKAKELMETGKIRALEREKTNPLLTLTQVYGVGSKKAETLIKEHDITSIQDLRKSLEENPKLLNDKQKIGVKYYNDLVKRIPRREIEVFKKVFEKAFQKAKDVTNLSKATFEIVGSYRRGAETSGDIDIIITEPDNNDEIYKTFMSILEELGIIIEFLSKGPKKSMVIGWLNDKHTARRIDFMFTPPEEYSFAILYFTGSAAFNTAMRHRANELQYTMNEHGLYKFIGGKKGQKLDLFFEKEEDIFKFLSIKYIKPEERIDGTSMIIEPSDTIVSETKSKGIENVKLKSARKTKKTKETKEKTKSRVSSLKRKHIEKTLKTSTQYLTSEGRLSVDEHLENFIHKGIDYLYTLGEKTLAKMIRIANDAYYNKSSVLTDGQYDILKDYMETTYPKNTVLKEIGAPIEKNKVKLPYFMGSMDKIKPDTGALKKWKTKFKGPYILSAKLDGISALYTYDGTTKKLYTRGDGTYGQDITYLIPYLNLPEPETESIVIRGEIIMKKKVFEKYFKEEAANARNLVSGIVNSKTSGRSKFKYLDFVAYEVISPELNPVGQMSFLETLRISMTDQPMNIVLYSQEDSIDNEMLSEYLISWREGYEYEIDGVIVTSNVIVKRKEGNPEHSIAFKMVLSDQVVEARVVDVLWSASKDGYLKPRVKIEPVVIGGARIEYATAFNAAFVKENRIGVGSLIQLVRSGDVIPHIMSVIEPAQQPKMPDVDYVWNSTNVDIILTDPTEDDTVREKNISRFFAKIGVVGLGPGNIRRFIDAGYDSVGAIIRISVDDILKIDGFKQRSATKIYNAIHESLDKAQLGTLVEASNIFGRGFGEKKVEPLLKEIPDIFERSYTKTELFHKINGIPGFGSKTTEAFLERYQMFIDFMKSIGLKDKLKKPTIKTESPKNIGHPLYDRTIIMTGFRDKSLKEQIEKVGGKIGTTVNKKTFIVLTKDPEDETGKINKAKELDIPIMTPEEFTLKYLQ
jgi:DNA ligase (NAD+)